jgi:hypothetical protein
MEKPDQDSDEKVRRVFRKQSNLFKGEIQWLMRLNWKRRSSV